ncbi:MAG: hypothetical protein R8G34_06385 [Paracoccaceae bacterium]|nr:hypothetical protein [Paracoccaceae bacterium]
MKREPLPILVGERQAARLFDQRLAQLRALVEGGALPRPKTIGEFERWDTMELCRVASGDAIDGMGDVQW